MKYYGFAALFALLILVAGACLANSTPAPDLEATVEAAVKATLAAQLTDTHAPDADELHPIETTVAAAVEATLSAQPTGAPSSGVEPAGNPERLYRSYPAPTGFPGFRKYYQKRCYPGCHYDAPASGAPEAEVPEGTPTPQVAHP